MGFHTLNVSCCFKNLAQMSTSHVLLSFLFCFFKYVGCSHSLYLVDGNKYYFNIIQACKRACFCLFLSSTMIQSIKSLLQTNVNTNKKHINTKSLKAIFTQKHIKKMLTISLSKRSMKKQVLVNSYPCIAQFLYLF